MFVLSAASWLNLGPHVNITQVVSYTNDTLDCGFNVTWSWVNMSVEANVTWFRDANGSSGFVPFYNDNETEINISIWGNNTANYTFSNTSATGDIETIDTNKTHIFRCQVTTYDNLTRVTQVNSTNFTVLNLAPIVNVDTKFVNSSNNHSMIAWANFSDADGPADMTACKFFVSNESIWTTESNSPTTGNCTTLIDFYIDNYLVNEELKLTIQVYDGSAYVNSTATNNTLNDPIPPSWQNQSQNNSYPFTGGGAVILKVRIKDYGVLSSSVLSTNESGSWYNHSTLYGSPKNMGSVRNLLNWSNFTWSNNSIIEDTVIGWRIWSNDSVGNWNKTDIYNFTITVPTTSGTGSSGSGGKSSNLIAKTKKLDNIIRIKQDDKVFFKIKEKQHTMNIDNIDSILKTVTLTISSSPITVILEIGETRLVDVDDNGLYDLDVTLSGIEYGEANLILKEIGEIRGREQSIRETSKEIKKEEKIIPERIDPVLKTKPKIGNLKQALLVILIVVILAVIISVLIFYSTIKSKIQNKIQAKNFIKKKQTNVKNKVLKENKILQSVFKGLKGYLHKASKFGKNKVLEEDNILQSIFSELKGYIREGSKPYKKNRPKRK
ncbi:hypothetical protein CL621_02685 [archaeon]|nr:hypothetical protein [archaeon]|tara:strand:- start:2088 stop:3908 length:1821 start_codon:yes stop_codon:yes gene_type:complete